MRIGLDVAILLGIVLLGWLYAWAVRYYAFREMAEKFESGYSPFVISSRTQYPEQITPSHTNTQETVSEFREMP
ncbi:MAG: hypothetical protein ACYC0V_13280 [Armatimonadota bacterium]